MYRSRIHIVLSLLLTCSILSPSALFLFEKDYEYAIVLDQNEEDHQQEEKKDTAENDVFFFSAFFPSPKVTSVLAATLEISVFPYNGLAKEILLPPPEYLS